MRLLPKGIAGQIAVLVVAAIVCTHALATATFMLVREPGPPPVEDHPGAAAYRLSALVRAVEAAPPADRPAMVASFARALPEFALAVGEERGPALASPGGPEHPVVRDLRRFLPSDLRVAQRAGPTEDRRGESVRIGVALPGGATLGASLPSDPPRRGPPGGPLLTTLAFLLISLVLLSVWAARALARPLDQLAAAADRFGTASDFAPLPERGPNEVLRAAQALARMRDRVKRLIDDRSGMLAAVSHDLRTPLTRLRLRAEFLDPDTRRVVLRDLDQMNGMVEAALAFVRDGQRAGPPARVDLASLARTVCDLFADAGREVGYSGPDRMAIEGRADEIERGLGNLVDNALKYGTRAAVALERDGREVRLSVSDDGPGIPPADLERVLEPFVRGDPSRNLDGPGGFGLGLAITRAVAERQGGRLELRNLAAGGLCATLVFPAPGREAPPTPDATVPAGARAADA